MRISSAIYFKNLDNRTLGWHCRWIYYQGFNCDRLSKADLHNSQEEVAKSRLGFKFAKDNPGRAGETRERERGEVEIID